MEKIDEYANYTESNFSSMTNPNTVSTLILCLALITLFVFGLVGNLWVIFIAGIAFRKMRANKNETARTGGTNPNTVVYIFVLSVVDLLVMTNIPFLLSDLYFNEWLFGYHLCKAYWILDTVNKVLSKYVLAAMSFDRFISVCKPRVCRFLRTFRGTIYLLIAVCITVTFSTYPLYANSQLIPIDSYYERNDNESESDYNSTEPEYDVETVHKCAMEVENDDVLKVTLSFFVVGYFAPSVFIVCFYCGIFSKLRHHHHHHVTSGASTTSRIPVKKITRLILVLICVDLVCWTPFWVMSLYTVLKPEPANQDADRQQHHPGANAGAFLVPTMYAMHVLVYANSAINWIPYAYMNKNAKSLRSMAGELKRQNQVSESNRARHSCHASALYKIVGRTSSATPV